MINKETEIDIDRQTDKRLRKRDRMRVRRTYTDREHMERDRMRVRQT